MKVRTRAVKSTRLKRGSIALKNDVSLPRLGRIDGLEVEQVLFSLLDGLVESSEKIRDSIVKTLMKFAHSQPEIILKSILAFLQVQKTSINHQRSLLSVIRRCVSEVKFTDNSVIKDLLIFMLKELAFLRQTDARHLEMVEIVNVAVVLCPSFSVDLILAFIKDMKLGDDYFEVLCIYLRILTHLCRTVPRNSYVKSILISSHVMTLYNRDVFKEQNLEICKELASFLYHLTNMLHFSSYFSGTTSYYSNYLSNSMAMSGFKAPLSGNQGLMDTNRGDVSKGKGSGLVQALNVEDSTVYSFLDQYLATNNSTGTAATGGSSSSELNDLNLITTTNNGSNTNRSGKNISRPSLENIKAILEPLYPLLLDHFIPKIYINPVYYGTCLELVHSLIVMSEYISSEGFKLYSKNLLDCTLALFLNYLRGLKMEDNFWVKLFKSNVGNLGNKFTLLFSSNVFGEFPPKFFIIALRVFMGILSVNDSYQLFLNCFNLCNILFSLLTAIANSSTGSANSTNGGTGSQYLTLLTTLETFSSRSSTVTANSSGDDDNEVDDEYINNVIMAFRVLSDDSSCTLLLNEFLYEKLTGKDKVDLVVALSIYTHLLNATSTNSFVVGSSTTNTGFISGRGSFTSAPSETTTNRGSGSSSWHLVMYRILTNINRVLNVNISGQFQVLIHFINSLLLNRHVDFYTQFNRRSTGGDAGSGNGKIYYLINFLFEYAVVNDIEQRVDHNMAAYSAITGDNSNEKVNLEFFHSLYQYTNSTNSSDGRRLEVRRDVEECLIKFIQHSVDTFLPYLLHKLMNNVKRNCLVVLKYLDVIFDRYPPEEVKVLLKRNDLLQLYLLVVIYLHDTLSFFGEAYYGSKLLFKLGSLISTANTQSTARWDDTRPSTIGSNYDLMDCMETNLSGYDGLDSFYLNSATTISTERSGDSMWTFISPYNIRTNFNNVSRAIKVLNKEYRIGGDEVLRALSTLVPKLKNRTNLNRTTSFSFSTTFSTGSISLFGGGSSSGVVTVNGVTIDTDLTLLQNLGILNLICIYSDGYNSVITPLLVTSGNEIGVNSLIKEDDKELLLYNTTTNRSGGVVPTATNISGSGGKGGLEAVVECKYVMLSLIGAVLSNLISEDNYKQVLLLLDELLVLNPIKDSFSIFGKSSSYVSSERVRLIILSAFSFTTSLTSARETDTTTICTNDNGMKRRFNDFVKDFNAKRAHLEGDVSVNSPAVVEEHFFERYVLAHFILMYQNEPDLCLRSYILFHLRMLFNTISNSSGCGLEFVSLLFNSLIGNVMNLVDSEFKFDEKVVNQRFSEDRIVQVNVLKKSPGSSELTLAHESFLLLSSFATHYKQLLGTSVPLLVLYYLIQYSDYYNYLNASDSRKGEKSRVISIVNEDIVGYIMVLIDTNGDTGVIQPAASKTGSSSRNYKLLYTISNIVMNNNNPGLKDTFFKNRLDILIHLFNHLITQSHLSSVTHTTNSSSQEEEDWIKMMILIWSYILKVDDNDLKLMLIDIIPFVSSSANSPLRVGRESFSSTTTISSSGTNSDGSDDCSGELINMERINKLNGIDEIYRMVPDHLIFKFVQIGFNFLRKQSCVSKSLVRIIHSLLSSTTATTGFTTGFTTDRCDETATNGSSSILWDGLIIVLDLFENALSTGDPPPFLKSFLLFIFKYDIDLLRGLLFTTHLKVQWLPIIVKDYYLLDQLIQYLQSYLDPTTTKSSSETVASSDGDNNSTTSHTSCNGRDETFKVGAALDQFIDYNIIIFKHHQQLIQEYHSYVNALIVFFISSLSTTTTTSSSSSNSSNGDTMERMIKLFRILGNSSTNSITTITDNSTAITKSSIYVKCLKNEMIKWSVVILGNNKRVLNSFLDYVLNTIITTTCTSTDGNSATVDLLKILVRLMKGGYLMGHDLMVLKIIKLVPNKYKLVYYYFKHLFGTGINPYFNIYNGKFPIIKRERRRFLSQVMGGILSSNEGMGSYYYNKLLLQLVRIVANRMLHTPSKTTNYFVVGRGSSTTTNPTGGGITDGLIEEIILKVVRMRTFYSDKRVRFSYLQLHHAILRYVVKVYGNTSRLENLRTHLFFPLVVACVSTNSESLQAVSRRYLNQFVNTFLGRHFITNQESITMDLIEGMMVKGFLKFRCPCGCNGTTTTGSNGKRLCLSYTFQLLYLFFTILKEYNENEVGEKSGGSSTTNRSSDSGSGKCNDIPVPINISEEFKRIRKRQMDHKSSQVLFNNESIESLLDDRKELDSLDIDRYYRLNTATTNPGGDGRGHPTTVKTGSNLMNVETSPINLMPLQVSDYYIKQGRAKCQFLGKCDSLEEYLVDHNLKSRVSLVDIDSLDTIGNSLLFTSNEIYRFITCYNYLIQTTNTTDSSRGVEDEAILLCIKLSMCIIKVSSTTDSSGTTTTSSSSSSDDDMMNKCDLVGLNYKLHFEAICNALLNQVCKLAGNDKFKLYTFKALQLVSNIQFF